MSNLGIQNNFVITSKESLEASLSITFKDHRAQFKILLGLTYILALTKLKLGCVTLASYVTALVSHFPYFIKGLRLGKWFSMGGRDVEFVP